MSDLVPVRRRAVEHFGPIARCRVHEMRDGCECRWDDCLPELQPYTPPTFEFTEGAEK